MADLACASGGAPQLWFGAILMLISVVALAFPPSGYAQETIAIADVTVIDGTGADPARGVMVLIRDGLIGAIGTDVEVPSQSARIDGRGKYLVPGFIDSNVHASVYGNATRRETVVKYGEQNADLALEFVQRQLKHGVTTVRDSYGALVPLMEVRDRIDEGGAVGARLLVAGNIVGWGGPFSMTFSLMQESELTLFQARWNDWIAQGVGEELMDMGPEEVRVAINAYLDKGPDFIKYGGTSHFSTPSLIGFSPRVQKVIVEETHRRGLIAETHATSPEALRMSVEAGIDLIQHPEILSRDYPEALIELIVDRDLLCAIRSNTLAGEPWRDHLLQRREIEKELQDTPEPKTSAERRARQQRLNLDYEIQRRNAERLIRSGCRVTIATDNYQGRAPEFRKEPKPVVQEAGIGSILAIEGLVELGMSEMDAIVAATRNGAIAAGMLDRIGTIETGKEADVVLLGADPLDDIANIRKLVAVIARGRLVDINALPEQVLFYTGPPPRPSQQEQVTRVDSAADTPDADALPAASGPAATSASLNRDAGKSGSDVLGSGLPISRISETPLGRLVIELENGQVWRQLDSDITPVALPRDRSGLTAELKRAFLGSIWISISGTGRSFKVSRIR